MASCFLGFLSKCQVGASEPFHQVHSEALKRNIFKETRMILAYKHSPFNTGVACA